MRKTVNILMYLILFTFSFSSIASSCPPVAGVAYTCPPVDCVLTITGKKPPKDCFYKDGRLYAFKAANGGLLLLVSISSPYAVHAQEWIKAELTMSNRVLCTYSTDDGVDLQLLTINENYQIPQEKEPIWVNNSCNTSITECAVSR